MKALRYSLIALFTLTIGLVSFSLHLNNYGFELLNTSNIMLNKQSVTIVIAGFAPCGDYIQATNLANEKRMKTKIIEFPNKGNFTAWLDTKEIDDERPINDERARNHRTSPYIFELETKTFIG
jgi:hypothetical protein